jgi:hypothetical protein
MDAAVKGGVAAERRKAEARLRLAQENLRWMEGNRMMTNYPEFIAQCDAERTPETVTARKKFYQAERLRQQDDSLALAIYREAIEDWTDVMLRFPTFARAQDIQEDSYEAALDALKRQMVHKKPTLERLLTGLSDIAWQDLLRRGTPVAVGDVFTRLWPASYLHEPKSEPDGFAGRLSTYLREQGLKMRNIMPMREARGPLDLTYVYNGTDAARRRFERVQVAAAQLGLSSHPDRVGRFVAAPQIQFLEDVVTEEDGKPHLKGEAKSFVERFRRRLSMVRGWYGQRPGADWIPLVDDGVQQTVRDRRGWTVPAQQPAPQRPTEKQEPKTPRQKR